MKLLFVLRHALYLRNYESVIRELASQGHDVVLAFTPMKKFINPALLDDLSQGHANVKVEWLPARSGRYTRVADGARRLLDYLRYLAPEFKQAPKLRDRAGSPVPAFIRAVFNIAWPGDRALRKTAGSLVRLMERAWPIESSALDFLKQVNPDVLLVSPLIDLTYKQQEYLKAARLAGIPSALLVASWDNLTNKGLIQIEPDAVLLWNEFQKDEAVRLHGIDPSKVIVTGAQLYDQWFDKQPSTTFDEYCQMVGLASGRPLISYMCSSTFIAREEIAFVHEWIAAIRSHHDEKISTANILIRPYPGNPGTWSGFDVSQQENVVVWPPEGAHPINDRSKTDYFDCLYHSAAVVGVNTSAFLEAGILMRPVLTVRDPRFFETQDGTLHFHYLLMDGFLASNDSLSTHVDALAALLNGDTAYRERNQRFISKFVRPFGSDISSTSRAVSAILQLKGASPTPFTRTFLAPILLAPFFLLAFLVRARPKRRKSAKRNATNAAIGILPAAKLPMRGKALRISARVYLKLVAMLGLRRDFRLYALPLFLRSYNIVENPGRSRDKPASAAKKAAKLKALAIANSMPDVLANLARTTKPILVGPWLSEVGFETLYWIPFLNWAARAYGLPRDRFIIVSRGGVRHWYTDLGYASYIDAFEFFSPAEFKARIEERWGESGGFQKQMHMSGFDNELIERAAAKLGLGPDEVEVLHPSLMYSFYRQYWRGEISLDAFLQHADFRPWQADEKHKIVARLPSQYVAVRFYFRPSFPDTPQNRQFIKSIISAVSRSLPVVVLSPNFQVDDHQDFLVELGEDRIITIEQHMSPENNLEVQSAVIANSELFIGTYGGLSYLAPLYGVPALACYSDRSHFLETHLQTAHAAFQLVSGERAKQAGANSENAVPFTVLAVSEVQTIIQLLAAAGQPDKARRDRGDRQTLPSTDAGSSQIRAAN